MYLTEVTLYVKLNKYKYKYILIERIVNFILGVGAIVFGGFVTDKFIHDHYAALLYEKNRNSREKYSDATFDSDTKYRLLVPNDIDAFFHGTECDVENLYKKLHESGFKVVQKKARNMYHSLKHVKQRKVSIKVENDFISSTVKREFVLIFCLILTQPSDLHLVTSIYFSTDLSWI